MAFFFLFVFSFSFSFFFLYVLFVSVFPFWCFTARATAGGIGDVGPGHRAEGSEAGAGYKSVPAVQVKDEAPESMLACETFA